MTKVKYYREDREEVSKLIKEAKEGVFISDDYATGKSEYVTIVYENNGFRYIIVDNIDLGVLYSVEKVEIEK